MSCDELLRAALLRALAPWPDAPLFAVEEFMEQVRLHGIAGILLQSPAVTCWPDDIRASLQRLATSFAFWELRHQEVVARAIQSLATCGAQPIVFKGTALAYGLYDDPALRVRGDTDVLVAPNRRSDAHHALVEQGFECVDSAGGEHTSHQASYSYASADTGQHFIDLHWKVNNSPVLSKIFTHAEMLRSAQPLPRLSPAARAPSPTHSLLLACMHRAAHTQNPLIFEGRPVICPDRMVWLADIHGLASALQGHDWVEVVALAQSRSMRAVTLDGLEGAAACFGTSVPADVLSELRLGGRAERPYRYMAGSKLSQQWMDFLALDSMADRLGLIRELFAPSAHYMRAKYGAPQDAALLPLYVSRAIRGVTKAVYPRTARTESER